MTLDFFYKNYNLLKENVLLIEGNGEQISIKISLNVDIFYIGNGLRTSFEFEPTHEFTIAQKCQIFSFANPKIVEYTKTDNVVKIVTNNGLIEIYSNNIECTSKF